MDLVINFNKSLQDRLNEYEIVFGTGEENGPLAYSKIHHQFSIYLELVMDPNGWQALWKIPRLKCEEFKISFPTIVLVYVQNVDFTDLTALTRILAVQEDNYDDEANNLASTHYVPLVELWPTKKQDKSIALNLDSTANAVDTLRFFHLYIEMPWDVEEDSADWISEHLISRLRLYFDLRNGTIPKSTSEYICSLIYEAKRLDRKREYLQDKIDDQQNEEILEMNVRIIQIQNELNLYENEAFRRVLLKKRELREDADDNQQQTNKVKLYAILPFGKPEDYSNILKVVKETHPNEVVSFASSLMNKLISEERDEILFLGPLTHKLNGGVLIRNSQIRGVGNVDEVKIHSFANGNIMLDCVAEDVLFENLTIECTDTDTAMLIRKGKVTLKNCKLIGSISSTTSDGIIVLDGTYLLLDSCELYGFSRGIVGNNGSKIEIINSVIKGAKNGVTIFDDCLLKIRDSAIIECEKYGIILQTTQDIANSTGFEALNSVSSIKLENIRANKNGKCDAIIQKFTLHAIEDLFADSDLMKEEN